jgi:hypothetical protein
LAKTVKWSVGSSLEACPKRCRPKFKNSSGQKFTYKVNFDYQKSRKKTEEVLAIPGGVRMTPKAIYVIFFRDRLREPNTTRQFLEHKKNFSKANTLNPKIKKKVTLVVTIKSYRFR